MESVEILLDLITNHHSDVPIPGCLTHCINLELFHCKICSEPFTNIHSLIRHGKKHVEEGNTTCSYCGEDFGSLVALSLHQLVRENKQEADSHVGEDSAFSQISNTRNGGNLVTSELEDNLEICPRCGMEVKTSQSHSLEVHVVTSCKARSEVVTRAVNRIINMTDLSDLQPMDVLKMEIESVVNQFENLQNGAADPVLTAAKILDRQNGSLPDNFSRDILLKVPVKFSANGECEMFLQQFDVWSEYVSRMAGPDEVQDIIAQYEEIVSRSSAEPLQWKMEPDTDKFSLKEYYPEAQYLSKLETEIVELGEVSVCPRELESLVNQLKQEMEL